MEGALAFSKQINSMGRQSGGVYWYLNTFSDNRITHFMQQLPQNCKKLMTTFSVNRYILCKGYKTDDVCLRLTQQVCCKSIKLMLEYFAELGPLRVMDLCFLAIIHIFPAVIISLICFSCLFHHLLAKAEVGTGLPYIMYVFNSSLKNYH